MSSAAAAADAAQMLCSMPEESESTTHHCRVLQGGLSPPSPLGSSLLLPRPWAALLRLLLQQKVPAATLRALAGPVIPGEEEALEEVVWACLPKITRDIWQQTPHRMYSAEAEVGGD